MMELVTQSEFGQCGIACAAMVLGVSLDDVLQDFDGFDWRVDGVTTERLVDYLKAKDQPAMESLVWPSSDIPVIATVPSLNHPGLLHYVVWDGKQLLDPSPGPLRYPNDTPIVGWKHLPVQWASVILIL